ncbi:MAG TPA: energy transducer TonB [Saprospiraceae bacterium]|jgi:protein TonB|nr:energy transducer TonB [Saprospiraceae bacterium]
MKIILFPCLLIILCSLSNTYGQANPNLSNTTDEETFKVVEEIPRFPGCEDIEDLETKNKCAQKKMLTYIYKNLKYPKEARKYGIEGVVVVQFVLDIDGSILDVRPIPDQSSRDLGSGLTEAAIEAVQSMNNMKKKWIPGKQNGRPVRVLYTLPIKFKL